MHPSFQSQKYQKICKNYASNKANKILWNVKLWLSGISHIEYWELSNILANTAVAVNRANMYMMTSSELCESLISMCKTIFASCCATSLLWELYHVPGNDKLVHSNSLVLGDGMSIHGVEMLSTNPSQIQHDHYPSKQHIVQVNALSESPFSFKNDADGDGCTVHRMGWHICCDLQHTAITWLMKRRNRTLVKVSKNHNSNFLIFLCQ
jgi:hypothetical protein